MTVSNERATLSPSSPATGRRIAPPDDRLRGPSSIPETLMMESRGPAYWIPRMRGCDGVCVGGTGAVIARSGSDESIHAFFAAINDCFAELSSDAHSRDPLARNDETNGFGLFGQLNRKFTGGDPSGSHPSRTAKRKTPAA